LLGQLLKPLARHTGTQSQLQGAARGKQGAQLHINIQTKSSSFSGLQLGQANNDVHWSARSTGQRSAMDNVGRLIWGAQFGPTPK